MFNLTFKIIGEWTLCLKKLTSKIICFLLFGIFSQNVAFASILVETHVESDNRGYLALSVEDLNGSKVCIFDFNFEECVRILEEIDHKKIEKNVDELTDLIRKSIKFHQTWKDWLHIIRAKIYRLMIYYPKHVTV